MPRPKKNDPESKPWKVFFYGTDRSVQYKTRERAYGAAVDFVLGVFKSSRPKQASVSYYDGQHWHEIHTIHSAATGALTVINH